MSSHCALRSCLPRLAVVSLLAGATLGGGCVDNDRSLTITQFIPETVAAGACSFDPSSAVTLGGGTFDVAIASRLKVGYEVGFVVANNLGSVATVPIDTQAYYINSYNVDLELSGALAAAIPASERSFNDAVASTRLAPGSKASSSVRLITPEQAVALAQLSGRDLGQIVAHVHPVATRAEEQVVGAASSFPVDVCYGCLTLTDTATNQLLACPLTKEQLGTSPEGNVCNPAADKGIACCAPDNTHIVCGTAAGPPAPTP